MNQQDRKALLNYLQDEYTPLYSLDELAEQIGLFLDHLILLCQLAVTAL